MTIWHTGGRKGSPGVNEPTSQQVNEAMVSKIRNIEYSRTRKIENSSFLSLGKILHKGELGVQFLGSSEVFCLTL